MLTKVYRVVRLVTVAAGLYTGVKELRSGYSSRKHLWQILRRLVRQLG
ncbi:hypothetical protein [Tumebacillus permanentifrigoris]|uniref:Uncharacterized protein n=1 Tax=Tumebacillus permanentifrigoris TaxID=378543 RepID=A0A316D458_9BACL|nr:hypothetical protein [Tumebacillus permanentifrigoris]PWK06961.1 hypothetical protein C7459_11825 [Tumebacillus permanentifrigoris]